MMFLQNLQARLNGNEFILDFGFVILDCQITDND